MKIRTWDLVQVMSGKSADKNKQAKVLKVFKSENKVLVDWVNFVTRHIKKSAWTPGQIVKMEKEINASNVMLVCPFTNKPTRVWLVAVIEKDVSKTFRYSKVAVKELKKDPKDLIIK